MFRWIPYAMVRISLFFIAGILLAIYQADIFDSGTVILLLCMIFPAYCIGYWVIENRQTRRVVLGMLGLSAVFLLGYLHLLFSTGWRNDHHLLAVKEPVQYYEAIVRSTPESKARSWKLEVEVTQVKTDAWQDIHGKVLLYISKQYMESIPWQYGDRLLVRGNPVALRPPANPYEFDFKRFLGFRNIYHQQFIRSDIITKVADVGRKGFIYYSMKARVWATSVVEKYIKGEQQQVIANALVLGVTEGIDTELQDAYAASGAMHVLAVSGLHVGVIYAILLFLLKPLNRFAWSRWLVFVLSILCLWSFAFVTGLSPSVLRAVTMFSFIALARPLGWRTNIYNTLAGSAFLLLLFNPYLIMSVGFQLSYLAVLGIVYLQRPLYQLWEIENRLGDWIWQITSVSIAAQASTFALGMLYFHQFPVYFLVSNLFVIPLSTAVLVSGILLLVISAWSWAAGLMGSMVTYLIKLLNYIVFTVEDWPFSLIEEIHLTTFQCWLIMIFLLAMIFLIEFRSFRWLLVAGCSSLVLVVSQWIHFKESVIREQFVVYSINGFSAMEWMVNGHSYFEGDSILKADKERIRFHIRPNRLQSGVTAVHSVIPFLARLNAGAKVAHWKGRHIVFIHDKNYPLPDWVEIDYLVIGKNAVPVKQWPARVKQVILDGSNSSGYIKRWKALSEKEKGNVHAVLQDGAFILTD